MLCVAGMCPRVINLFEVARESGDSDLTVPGSSHPTCPSAYFADFVDSSLTPREAMVC